MAETIKISLRPEQIAAVEAVIGGGRRGNAVRALQAAISRTVTTGAALLARRIGEEVNMRIGDIKSVIDVSRGSYDKLEGRITLKRKPTWLSAYATTRQRTQVASRIGEKISSYVRPGGGIRVKVRKRPTPKHPTTEQFPHAFWAVMPHSHHVGIFQRIGLKRAMKSGRYKGKVREVIKRLRGPSALGVFLNAKGQQGAKTVAEEIRLRLGEVLYKNVQSQIQRFLNPRATDTVANPPQ